MAQVTVRTLLSGALGALVVLVGAGMAGRFALVERNRSLASTMPASVAKGPQDGAADAGAASATRGTRGVLVRLTDELGKAQLSVPKLTDRAVTATLSAHWRRHLCPFAGPGGERGRLVQSVSLDRHLAPTKKELDAASAPPDLEIQEQLRRDTQTFGLGEGSFDEREAIVLPPPGSVRYTLNLPKGATLRLAPAVLGEGEAHFVVRCRPAGTTAEQTLFALAEHGPSKRWTELSIDLSPCVGETELELATESTSKQGLVALFGTPVVLAPAATTLPYNVVFVIVDAMRGDAIAAAHDPETDAKREQAKVPPLDAFIRKIPEVAPTLNALGAEGVTWQNAWSAAMWTRPATVAMLSGQRASRLGLSVLELELVGNERQAFYARRPPMLARFFREAGADTAAIVNNMYLSGSVGVGVDYAFESLVDHRYQALDTRHITEDALRYLQAHRDERFLLLLNYGSPHFPYVPPKADQDALRGAHGLPEDPTVRSYLAEIHKDDRAIGLVLAKLTELGLREETLVVVTADHGETMSAAHDIIAVDVAKGVRSGRFSHLSTMWDEAAKVGMVMSLPGKIPAGLLSNAPVQTLDLLPTILELEGLRVPDGLDGRSLVPLFAGKSLEERPIVIEGRGARSIQDGDYRLIVREGIAQRLKAGDEEFTKAVELYDHSQDPGERRDLADKQPARVRQLRAKLDRVLAQSKDATVNVASSKWHLTVALGGKPGHVELRLFALVDEAQPTTIDVSSSELDARAIRRHGHEVRVSVDASGDTQVGLDVELPHGAGLGWEVTLDGKPWPSERFFGGALGMRLDGVERGIRAALPASAVESHSMPHVAARHELGLFVIREPKEGVPELELSAAAQLEAEQAMQAWGYAKKPPKKKP